MGAPCGFGNRALPMIACQGPAGKGMSCPDFASLALNFTRARVI